MKTKGISLFVLSFVLFFSFPGVAAANFDQYGFNAEGRIYKGTLDNWELFLKGLPPSPYNLKETDTVLVERKWDKRFDPVIYGNLPLGEGAWQKVKVWENLSGDQLGWTWHSDLDIVYSPNAPIPGAIELTPEEIRFWGFYLVKQTEWLAGPHGEKKTLQDSEVNPGIVNKALHLGKQ
ncbi:hypothetical protein [Desulfitobacterium sp. AusDCA]|uniref:hypothetical protein n=1 Tax=Desulfitobacterium sp. AusDCA TaxID=3240383 RepID=UPI003DA75672